MRNQNASSRSESRSISQTLNESQSNQSRQQESETITQTFNQSLQYSQSEINFTSQQNENKTLLKLILEDDEDSISEKMSSVTFNDLLSRPIPPWLGVNQNGKFPGGSQEYLRKMYELSREGFLKPIRNEFQKRLFCSKSAAQLKERHQTNENKSMQIYSDAVLQDWQLGRDGLAITLEIPLERKCEFNTDREEFASLKPKNLIILVEEKSGCVKKKKK